MIHLNTIGRVTVSVDDTPVSPSNHQVFSALLYLVVERGKPVARRLLADLFFPHAEGAGHSVRQLVYRLRKLGISIDAGQQFVELAPRAASWDVEMLAERGFAIEAELEALRSGYLA